MVSDADVAGDGASCATAADAAGSATKAPLKRGHRARSEIWNFLTLVPNPHRETRSECRHCAQPVPHHHKSEKARAHLLRCTAFHAFVDKTLAPHERPEWLDQHLAAKQERLVLKYEQQQQQQQQQQHLRRKSTDAPAAAASAPPAAASGPTSAPMARTSIASSASVSAQLHQPYYYDPSDDYALHQHGSTARLHESATAAAAGAATLSALALSTASSSSSSSAAATNSFARVTRHAPAVAPESKRRRVDASSSINSPVSAASAPAQPPDARAIHAALAMFFYTTGAPFAGVESAHLQTAFRLSNAAVALPTLERLAGPLLDDAYAAAQARVATALRAFEFASLVVTDWREGEGEGDGADRDATPSSSDCDARVTYTVVAEQQALVVETASRAEERALEADALAAKIGAVLQRCGPTVSGVVTDNSLTHQRARRSLLAAHPRAFVFGCAAHGLHSLVRAIFGPAPPLSGAAADAHPLEPLARLTASCDRILALFAADDGARAELARLVEREAPKQQQRELPPRLVAHDWRSLRAAFEALLAVHAQLRAVVSARDFARPAAAASGADSRAQAQRDVLSAEFAPLLAKAVAVLEPIEALARAIDAPRATCSDVFFAFAKALPDAVARVPDAVLRPAERAWVLRTSEAQFNALYGDAHGIAYLLDPRYIGDGLDADVRKRIEDVIFDSPLASPSGASEAAAAARDGRTGASGGTSSDDDDDDDRRLDLAQQLTEFVIDATREKSSKSFRYTLLRKRKKTALQYWLTDGQRWPLLQRLARQVFSLPATTAVAATAHAPSGASDWETQLSPAARAKLAFVRATSASGERSGSDASDAAVGGESGGSATEL